MQVTWSDVEHCGGGLVQGLVGAWRALLAEAAKTDSASGMPAVLWINVTYDDDTQTLAGGGLAGLLPRLSPVTQDNVSEWLAIDEVKRAVTGFEPKLLALADDDSVCIERGRMHMPQGATRCCRRTVRCRLAMSPARSSRAHSSTCRAVRRPRRRSVRTIGCSPAAR